MVKEKTLEDYQNREKYLIRYYTGMIQKQEFRIKRNGNDQEAIIKRNLYKEMLFKLTYEKPAKFEQNHEQD